MPTIREGISEADSLGLQYLVAAGYEPNAALRSLERLQAVERESPRVNGFGLGTHPATAGRIEAMRQEIASLSQRERSTVNTSEFEEMKRRVR